MNRIKFSHDYLKLPDHWNGKFAMLKGVHNILLEKQNPALILYDTVFWVDKERREKGWYDLPAEGKYLLLIFEMYDKGGFFTTFRRWTSEKEEYYRSNIDKQFVLEKEV